MANVNIDTAFLIKAMDFFSKKGYVPVSVPMIAGFDAIEMTLPDGLPVYSVKGKESLGAYVGSAEQSFIQMIIDGNLPFGKYMALTPCVRYEEEFDDIHFPIFMKLELVDYASATDLRDDVIIGDVLRFLINNINQNPDVVDIETDGAHSKDIEYNGIEYGSYGKRRIGHFGVLHYGTGVAFPRASHIINMVESQFVKGKSF